MSAFTRIRLRPLGVLLALGVFSALAACGGSASSSLPPPPAPRHVSSDFVGLSAAAVLDARGAKRARGLRAIAASGAGLVRQTFDWAQVEHVRGRFDFSGYDDSMAATSRAGLSVLPILFHPPAFRSSGPRRAPPNVTFPPRRNADMARFAAAVVRRYGPRGTFWAHRHSLPRRPIRAWQVWNEPNLPVYWGGHPDARAYVALLRAVNIAIKRADPRAEVVAAGLPDSRIGVPFEAYATAMYRAGARSAFDVLAVHAYAADADGVLSAVQLARALSVRFGDGHVPIWLTEVGWASGGPPSAFTVGLTGQGARIERMLLELAAQQRSLGVRGVVYYDWQDGRPYAGGGDFFGLHTGLLELDGKRKPAYDAWVRTVAALRRSR